MTKIFLSYRRAGSSDVTGRIFDHLKAHFGEDQLFKDVDSIPLGKDFRGVITEAVEQCKVLIAVIGDDWLSATDEDGVRRIDDPDDYVHMEIATALQREILVIPVLVERASMPSASDLPEALKELAFRNATSVRADPDFRPDIERLTSQLTRYVRVQFRVTRGRFAALSMLVMAASVAVVIPNIERIRSFLSPSREERVEARTLPDGQAVHLSQAEVASLIAVLRTNGVLVWGRPTDEQTDEHILIYLDRVSLEAKFIADVWRQSHEQLVNAAIEDREEEWKRLEDKLRLLTPPNTGRYERFTSSLSHFEDSVGQIAHKQDGTTLSTFIDVSKGLLETRGEALSSLNNLAIASNDESESIDVSEDRNAKLKEFGKIVQSLASQAADIEALATSIRQQLKVR